ncbi:SsrA-binding protein [candidate division WWE3 bacterium CG10_big_fil_rev_8_21_14_0_10_32_10]|uniref:SsrA-binding protein n=1 Tax=candidate division WWE3 bacterium CG10_big_fil_rev_8_21_14_0_10_32_10 TaxID=1975090 RepID=A0A2H0R971_UNCKA|nr:MAG: SsrA-binding protein [candidate division WWE3 bacterium CG10_big_fil_rev_8_21_14_0_10_32_10]
MEVIITNRKARHNFEVLHTYSAGIKLLGEEVKALKGGHGNLTGSYVSEKQKELFILGFNISKYSKSSNPNYNPKRPRKLLLNRKEISEIKAELHNKGRTVVPLKVYLHKNLFKVDIAVVKGMGGREKKASLKEKQIERDTQRELKESGY